MALEPKQLEILAFLADKHARETVSAHAVYTALWSGTRDTGGNVHHHISKIRNVLGDDKKTPCYIITLPNDEGYCFVAPVRKQGDLGFLDGLLEWSSQHFRDMLDQIEPNDADTEDLRITNMGFLPVAEIRLQRLLQRGVRVRIVLTNPKNEGLDQSPHDLSE